MFVPYVRPALLLLVGLSLVACGGSQVRGTHGADLGAEVEAPAPTAPRYDTNPSSDPVLGGEVADAVERGILAAAEAESTPLVGDGRLAILTGWVSEMLGDGGRTPPTEVVEFLARHLGLVEPVPHLWVLGQPDPAALEDGIRDSVARALTRHSYTHYGAAIVEREGLTVAVLALASRHVALEPVPRRLDAGAPISLRGALASGYRDAQLAVLPPEGDVVRRALTEGAQFATTVDTSAPGTYRVELLAHGPRGDSVVANFPVFVGVPIPDRVALRGADSGAVETDAPAAAAELLRLLNRTRASHGLAPLEAHRGLADVATAHSHDMIEHDFIGHRSPTTGAAADRVQRAGYRSGLILENIGRGYSAATIHDGLMESPGHRANVLNPDVTHVGIGVVAEEEGSRVAFVATEVFIQMAQEIDTGAAPAQLLAMINEGRTARGAESVASDEVLAREAQRAAEEYFARPEMSQQDAVEAASAALRRFAVAYRRVGGVMAVVSVLSEAGQLEPTFDPELRSIGIGVAQGNRPDAPPNSIAVVILFAWNR